MTKNQKQSAFIIFLISGWLFVVLSWHYMTPIDVDEPIEIEPITVYSVICYPDGKYGWIDSDGFRDPFVYDTHDEAYENMNSYVNMVLRQPSKYPRDKYKTWEVCE
ncbi:MAG: hypothetical protein HQ509_09405 [Candidatus Marinimicrobia bacterium]|nr:hypothetical protein [Candidatus Neomarinimicrobiota bacterium]